MPPVGQGELPAVRIRLSAWLCAVGSLVVPLALHAAEPKAASPDAEFLEYLGSDDGDPELQQYLVKEGEEKPAEAKTAPHAGDGKT